MITQLFIILPLGLLSGLVYGFLFTRSIIPTARDIKEGQHRRYIPLIGTWLRLMVLCLLFWYLLRLPLADRILFLVSFFGAFWCFVGVLQRR